MRDVRPIYLDCNESMTIDPLYELNGEVKKVKTSEEFKEVICYYQQQDEEQALKQKDAVRNYCKNIFTSIDSYMLLKELS